MPTSKHIPFVGNPNEPWLELELANGAVLQYRCIVKGGLQIFNDDGTPMLNNVGQVTYGINFEIISVCIKEPPVKKEMN